MISAFAFCFALFSQEVFADPSEAALTQRQIQSIVRAVGSLAQSGLKEYRVRPGRSVRSMLLEMGMQDGYVSEESDFSWVGRSEEAWDAGSTNWGETNLSGAIRYLTTLDEAYAEELKEPGREAERARVEQQVTRVRSVLLGLRGSAIKFGVVPLGAVQCGHGFAALALINPFSGKITVIKMENSDC